MAAQLIVQPLAAPLSGSVPLPGDQEVAMARVALASLCRGRATLSFSGVQRSLRVLLDLLALIGVRWEREGDLIHVHGVGLWGAASPEASVDLRGEPGVAALALGLLVSRPFASELLVDDVVAELLVPALQTAHPMTSERLGATKDGSRLLLHSVSEGARSNGLSVGTHGVFAWVKQAILLAGLRASGPTVVEERLASADHLERAMTRARMPLDVVGTVATLHPPRDDDAVAPQVYEALGSHSLSVPLAVAALVVPGGKLTLREAGMNPTRSDLFTALRGSGASAGVTPRGDRQGEPFGDLSFQGAQLQRMVLGGETMIRLGDGALYLLALAARAQGKSEFSDLVPHGNGGDPRIFGRVLGLLRSAGVSTESENGVISVLGSGGRVLKPLQVTTGGDPRLALLATLLALGAGAPSVIDDVDCVAEEFPRWAGTLRALGAGIEVGRS